MMPKAPLRQFHHFGHVLEVAGEDDISQDIRNLSKQSTEEVPRSEKRLSPQQAVLELAEGGRKMHENRRG